MASYTVGTAAWTNGSHKVTFAYLSARHALFATSADSLTSSSAPPLNTTALTGQTVTGSIIGPAGAYDVKDTYNEEISITGASAEMRWVGDYNDAYYTTQTTSGGATHAAIVIRSTGNTVDGTFRVKLRTTINSDIGATYFTLPATTNGVWTELNIPLNATHTGMIRQVLLYKAAGGNFTVGTKVCIAGLYIHNNNNVVVRPTDTISPDYGVTNYVVDKVVHNYNSTGPIFVVYVKDAYTGTTSGGITTQRTEAATSSDKALTGTITSTADGSALLNISIKHQSVIDGLSSIISNLSTTDVVIKSFSAVSGAVSNITAAIQKMGGNLVSTISGSSAVTSVLDTSDGFQMGNAIWTNGSKMVAFQTPNTHIMMLNGAYPYTDANTGGLTAAGEWGTGSLDFQNPYDDTDDNVVQYSTDRAATSLTYKNLFIQGDIYTEDGFAQHKDNSQAARIMTTGSNASSAAGLHILNIVARISNNTDGRLSVSVSPTVTGNVVTTNAVSLPATTNTTVFHKLINTIPNSVSTFGQLSIFHTTNNTYIFNESLTIDSVYLTDDTRQGFSMLDKVSPDGGVTQYKVAKVLQSQLGYVTLVLETAYTGVTTTVDTLKIPQPVWKGKVTGNSSLSTPAFTRLQMLRSTITNTTSAVGSLLRNRSITSYIGTTTTVNGTLTRLQTLFAGISGAGNVTPHITLSKAFKSVVDAVGNISAVEYIRFKYNTAVISANALITKAYIGQARFFNSAVDAVSNISSFRTRLQLYTSTVVSNGITILAGTLGYVKVFAGNAINVVSSAINTTLPVTRGINTNIPSASTLTSKEFNIILYFTTNIDGTVSLSAHPNFLTGLTVTISATTDILPAHITKHSLLTAVSAAYGDIITSGEFRPIKFLSVIINTDSSITSHFIRDVTVNGVIYNEAEINASINKVLALSGDIDGDGKVKSYLSVPEKLRELLISSSGVLINGSDSIVNFSTKEETTPITVRGLTVVQFNDVVTGTNKTVIMMD